MCLFAVIRNRLVPRFVEFAGVHDTFLYQVRRQARHTLRDTGYSRALVPLTKTAVVTVYQPHRTDVACLQRGDVICAVDAVTLECSSDAIRVYQSPSVNTNDV